MARANFDRVEHDAGNTATGGNELASIRRAPVLKRGPRLHRGGDPDAVIESEYELYKDAVIRSVRGKLAARKIQYAGLDLDGFYNQAWHSVYMMLADGEEVDNRRGMLVTVMYRRAVDDFRALNPDRRAEVESLDALGAESDIDALLDDRAQIQQFIQGLKGRLSERELQAAGLCYVYGYTRPEAAKALGVRPRRMEKIMDEVSKKVTPMVGEIKSGEFCDSRASLMNAFAFGLLDEDTERYALAVEHLKDCSACRADVLRKRGIASIVAPLPFLLAFGKLGAAAGAGGVVGVAAGGHAAGSGGASGGFSIGSLAGGAGAVGAVGVLTAAIAVSHPLAAADKSSELKPIATPPAPVVASAKPGAAAKQHKVRKAHRPQRKAHRAKHVAPVQAQTPVVPPTPAPRPVSTPQPAPAPVHHNSPPPSTSDGAGEFDLK